MNTTYLMFTLIISPLIGGGVVYYIQSRIRINEAKEQVAIQGQASAAQTPLEVLRNELASKGVALQQTQQQFFQFVESQMKRNDATTKALLDVAAECRSQTDTLKAVGVSLQAHREESSARAGKIYEKISDVNERMAGMEANVKNASDAALEVLRRAQA